MKCCNFLFFGDVVGRPGRSFLGKHLPLLKEKYSPDFVFLNGENATGGFRLNVAIAKELKDMGVHGITLGNHTWNQRGFWEEIDSLDYVCRPANFPEECPGRTHLIFEHQSGKLALINTVGRAFSNAVLDCPFKVMERKVASLREQGVKNFIVDFHAEATAEKYTFGWFCSKLDVSCVVGTHTHVQTADERLLDQKMAFISDLGMCGSYNSILGFQPDPIIEKTLHGKPCRFEVGNGPAMLNGVCVRMDLENHCALSIERIQMVEM